MGNRWTEPFASGFFKYVQSRRKLLYPVALEHWNLLQLMLQTAMIPLEDVDGILDSILAGEQAEAAAALLQYKQMLTEGAATGFWIIGTIWNWAGICL